MSLVMNCDNCKYKHMNNDGGHCYMFEKPPEGLCAQFTGLKTQPSPQTLVIELGKLFGKI